MRIRAATKASLVYFNPMQHLRIVYSTHKLREHVLRSVMLQRARASCWFELATGVLTMIYFAPLLGTFGCACCRRRLLRLHVLPIARPILFHDTGGYDPRASIGLRQRAVVRRVKCKPRVHEIFCTQSWPKLSAGASLHDEIVN